MLQPPWTQDSFLDWVERQEAPYEFDGVQPVPMNGGTFTHALMGRNILIALHARLASRDLIVLGAGAGIATGGGGVRFPDAFVIATKPAAKARLMPDAVAAFEVVSPSSERTDRLLEPRDYAAVPSLRHYVVVEQAFIGLSLYSRAGPEAPWTVETITELDASLVLPALGIELPVREVYDGVELPGDPA